MHRPYRYHVFPCSGPRCTPEKGEAFKHALKALLPDRKALGVRVSTTSCQGMCEHGPNITIYPEGVVYHAMCEADLPRMVEEHLRGGKPVQEFAERLSEAAEDGGTASSPDLSPPRGRTGDSGGTDGAAST